MPQHRTHRVVDYYNGANPGFAVNDRPYYRLPWRLVFGSTIAAPAIGAAVGALEAFIAENSSRVSAYGGAAAARNPALHRPLARALTEVDAARARVRTTWAGMLARLERGETIPYEHRARCFYEVDLCALDVAPARFTI